MIFLVLTWVFIGGLVGLIANAANARPVMWQPSGWLRLLGLGAVSAFCGGWLGVLLFGLPFTIPMALWIAVAAVVSPFYRGSRSNGGSSNKHT